MFDIKKIVSAVICISIAIIFFTCKKEKSCENCGPGNTNKPPVAIAKPDTIITLPTDSILLDGSASYDPDGSITSWSWKKISGPVSFTIANASINNTLAKNLATGVYQFELTITDNGGLTAKDTVRITVDAVQTTNHPPVAVAGPDQTITLPLDSVFLNGSASYDPDNNIMFYHWVKLSGSNAFFNSPNSVQTKVNGLIPGVYLFELTVTDAGGLSSTDVVQVNVNGNGNTVYCGSPRPVVNAQLTQIGQLSVNRSSASTVAAGNKIFFAGGSIHPVAPYASTRVDIYDVVTQSWSTAELSTPRWSIAAIAAGNKVFFAGGVYFDDGDNAFPDKRVDIYDLSTNTWSIDSLSEPRYDIAAATIGNKVFFAGGIKGDYYNDYTSSKVDVYDLSNNTWSIAQLSQPKACFPATTVNNKIYFAGGMSQFFTATNVIDIYDHATNSWSTSILSEARFHLAGIAVNETIYWAGGIYTNTGLINDSYKSCRFESLNLNTGAQMISYLNHQEDFFVDGGQNAVVKNNKIVFFTGSRYGEYQISDNSFDIYDLTTGSFSVGILPFSLEYASLIAVNNTIYVAGGIINGNQWTNQVWKLEF